MLQTNAFTTWMTEQGYPLKTPTYYLRDIGRAEQRLGISMEPVSVTNTNHLLNSIGNEEPTRTIDQIENDQSAVNCYHEFRTGIPLPGYRRRGPRPRRA